MIDDRKTRAGATAARVVATCVASALVIVLSAGVSSRGAGSGGTTAGVSGSTIAGASGVATRRAMADASGDATTGTKGDTVRRSVVGVELIGAVTFDTGHTFEDTEFGGLSAITWDAEDTFYVLSDDRSQRDPARFYTVRIDLGDGSLDDGDVVIEAVTMLRDVDGEPFAASAVDPEGIAMSRQGTLFISSEGDAGRQLAPWVRELRLDGTHVRELPLPEHYAPNESGTRGVRPNLAFEPLTITPDGRTLLTGTENALQQDGPEADTAQSSPSRLLSYDVASGAPGPEYLFWVSPVPKPPVPPATYADNGLAEHIALDNTGTVLSLERSYAAGPGNTIRLFETRLGGAVDVSGYEALISPDSGETFVTDEPYERRLVADIEELGIEPDNLEGMTLGPMLPDGRRSLLLVSDNNFSASQTTQFIALALELGAVRAAVPVAESPPIVDVDAEDVPETALPGEALDVAVCRPADTPGSTRLIAALGSGGVLLMDVDGQPVGQPVKSLPNRLYRSVDVVHDFQLGDDRTVDLATAVEATGRTIEVFEITQDGLTVLTSPSMPSPIVTPDTGTWAPNGLASYASSVDGRHYVFVTERDGNRVAQVELLPDADGLVGGEVVRTVELPVWDGDLSGGSAYGIAVGQDPPRVFVAYEYVPAIVAFDAEPDASAEPDPPGEPEPTEPETIIVDESLLEPPLGGVVYGESDSSTPLLLVAHTHDSSIAAFEALPPHGFQGRFVIGSNTDGGTGGGGDGGIDGVTYPIGHAMTRLPVDTLTRTYRTGLIAVTDSSDEPQQVVQDGGVLRNASTGFKIAAWSDDLLLPVDRESVIYLPRTLRLE
ncbi:MAG: phytase [Anaerolineae bacterium]